ncbi:MAG: hypothetical protein FD153_1092, partial [Rhodospirillaceae bacterium]
PVVQETFPLSRRVKAAATEQMTKQIFVGHPGLGRIVGNRE